MRLGLSGLFRSRLNSAIEWRVIQEVDREREVIQKLQDSYVSLGLEFEARVRALEELILTLSERLTAVEAGTRRP